jgi:hypothetical protein
MIKYALIYAAGNIMCCSALDLIFRITRLHTANSNFSSSCVLALAMILATIAPVWMFVENRKAPPTWKESALFSLCVCLLVVALIGSIFVLSFIFLAVFTGFADLAESFAWVFSWMLKILGVDLAILFSIFTVIQTPVFYALGASFAKRLGFVKSGKGVKDD